MSFVDWLDYDWTIYEKEPVTIFGWFWYKLGGGGKTHKI